ncbi:Protein HEADING DATE 3A [Hibiscus syriacus]|uniref:Protein HEADING DATE 3A n=1 Tax=Hibiscus syriacus TaxID=106335 RepID=A0A6A3A7C5_HIBSY|nr:Protein HEADING DATE 3A [Hibiscus syriacus]
MPRDRDHLVVGRANSMPRGTDPLVVGRVIGDVLDFFTRVDIGGDDLRTSTLWLWWILMPPAQVTPISENICTGQEVVCYESPRPTVGIHHFVFVLFRQPGRQTVYAPGWRQNFNTRDFAELYNLGLPVAAVYFNCQRESGSGGHRR